MDLVEFGRRVGLVREVVLKAKQSELAEKLDITQVLLSRLENGVGGNIHTVFGIINYLDSLGMQGHLLFGKDFSIEMLTGKPGPSTPKQSKELAKMIRDMKKRNDASNADLDSLLENFC